MTMINLRAFSGMVPKVSTKLLQPEQAILAVNCDLSSGEIRPWYERSTIETIESAVNFETIYLFATDLWIWLDGDVDFVHGPIAGDTTHRTYFTGYGVPRVTNLTLVQAGQADGEMIRSYYMGIPAPTAAPLASVGSGGSGDPRSIAYVYTYVREWLSGTTVVATDEGPPSPPSNVVDAMNGQTVTVGGMFCSLDQDDYNITKKRIYRVLSGTEDAEYQYVDEIDVAVNVYTDTVLDEDLGEVLETTDYAPPPEDMKCLVSMPNGILAGISKNEVCFSEPWKPHAWPIDYRQAIDYEGVALGVFGTTLVVTTKGYPYLIYGTDPERMTQERLPYNASCISKRGLVSTEYGVVYPTPDGLFIVGPGIARMVTKDVLTKKEWADYNPTTIHACVHDGHYFGFYMDEDATCPEREAAIAWNEAYIARGYGIGGDLGAVTLGIGPQLAASELMTVPECKTIDGEGFVVHLGDTTPTITKIDAYYYALYVDPETDGLYLLDKDDDGETNYIMLWEGDTSSTMTHTYRSKTYVCPKHINFSCAKVVASDYDWKPGGLSFTLWADGAVRHEVSVVNSDPFRLPSGYLAMDHEIEVTGDVSIQEISIATSLHELAAT